MNTDNLQLTATNIRYLVAISTLGKKGRFVKCSDISRVLSVTRPSVHAMMRTLTEMELIEKPHYGKVTFTGEGLKLAQEYEEACSIARSFFRPLFPRETDIEDVVCAFIAQIPVNMLNHVCSNMSKNN